MPPNNSYLEQQERIAASQARIAELEAKTAEARARRDRARNSSPDEPRPDEPRTHARVMPDPRVAARQSPQADEPQMQQPRPERKGLIQQYFYDREDGGVKWGGIVGALLTGGAGYLMGGYINAATGASAGWLGLAATAALTLAGASFGARMGNNISARLSGDTDSPDRERGDGQNRAQAQGRSVEQTFEYNLSADNKLSAARDKGDLQLEGILHGKGDDQTFTVTHMIIPVTYKDDKGNDKTTPFRSSIDDGKIVIKGADINSSDNQAARAGIRTAYDAAQKATAAANGREVTEQEREAANTTALDISTGQAQNYNNALPKAARGAQASGRD